MGVYPLTRRRSLSLPYLNINSAADSEQRHDESYEVDRSPVVQSPISPRLLDIQSPLHRYGSVRSSKSAGVSTLSLTMNDDDNAKLNSEVPWQTGMDFLQIPKELESMDDSWEVAYRLAKNHDKDMCFVWREEIDHLILFASLFAATVVAFLAISYQMLKPDPTDIQNQVYIGLYAMWAAAYQANGRVFDLQVPPPPSPAPSPVFEPSASVLRMNVVWFLSLTLSLGTVLIGIISLQWIREYERDTRRGPKEGFALRQMRYDGINYWRVPLIISALPVFLQSSLLLFFWGMQEFLWSLNSAVTLINSIVIGAILFFIIATITLPALQCIFIRTDDMTEHQCPFKSPQSRIFSFVAFRLALLVIKFLQMFKGPNYLQKKREFLENLFYGKWVDWTSFDNAWQRARLAHVMLESPELESCDLPRGLAWLARKFAHKRESLRALHYFIRHTHPSFGLSALKKINEMDPSSSIQKFEPRWDGASSLQRSIISDILVAFLLHNQVKKNPRRLHPLLSYRLELLIRIANYRVIGGDPEGPDQPIRNLIDSCLQEEPCPLNPFPTDYDYTTLSDAYKCQIIMTFKNYLQADLCKPIIWSIAKIVVFQTTPPLSENVSSALHHALGILYSAFDIYFQRSRNVSQPDLELDFASGLLDHISRYIEIEHNPCQQMPSHPETFKNLYSLKKTLEDYKAYHTTTNVNEQAHQTVTIGAPFPEYTQNSV